MKVRCWFILCWFLFCVIPLICNADSDVELLERFPSGQINWTKGMVTAKGVDKESSDEDSALQQAVKNVYDTLLRLRVDDNRCVASLFTISENLREKVEEMASASKVLYIEKTPSGSERVVVEMSLYGGFAQLMLPSEIRQVQPIKALNGAASHNGSKNRDSIPSDTTSEPDAYTGLIVDARGIGAKPSMVPMLLDENGKEVFGPAYVSREFAVAHGVCKYVRMADDQLPESPRVKHKPMFVKGLRTSKPGSCNIIISNADASRLQGTSSHLQFLKQCRVVIVLD